MEMSTMKVSEAQATKKGKITNGHFVNISFSNASKGFYLFDDKIIATCGMENAPTPEMIEQAKKLIANRNDSLNLSISL